MKMTITQRNVIPQSSPNLALLRMCANRTDVCRFSVFQRQNMT